MNIQSPWLHAASREAAAPRPFIGATPTARDPAGFASLLRQTQAAPPPAPPAPPAPPTAPTAQLRRADPAWSPGHGAPAASESAPAAVPEHGPDADPMDPPNTADGTPTAAPQARPRPSAPGKPPPAAPTGMADRDAKPLLTEATDAAAERDTAAAAAGKAGLEPVPPLLQLLPPLPEALPAPWLAAPQPAPPGAAPGEAGGGAAAADNAPRLDAAGRSRAATAAVASAASAAASSTTGSPRAVASMKRDPDTATADAVTADMPTDMPAETPADAAANGALFAPALTEQRAIDNTPAPAARGHNVDATAPGGASFVPSPAAGSHATAPTPVLLATPVAAPAFAQERGLRMSVLARDGVQHAELHLNPADMGPVSVQIVLDGTQARVDFGADVAATRAAIEAGLPALAGALRDAGFTLTGGGVSQHSRGRGDARDGDGGTAAPRTRRVEGPALEAATGAGRAAKQRTVTLGGLDLYA